MATRLSSAELPVRRVDALPSVCFMIASITAVIGVSLGVFGLYYANYVNGWITAEDLDFYH